MNELMVVLKQNIEDVNVLDYDTKFRKMVKGFIESSLPDELEDNLNILSNLLYRKFWDIFPLTLRERNSWDNYFNRMVVSTKTTVLEIDKEPEKGDDTYVDADRGSKP